MQIVTLVWWALLAEVVFKLALIGIGVLLVFLVVWLTSRS